MCLAVLQKVNVHTILSLFNCSRGVRAISGSANSNIRHLLLRTNGIEEFDNCKENKG